MQSHFLTHLPDHLSTINWQGHKSSKFNGGRFHSNHPVDELDNLLTGCRNNNHEPAKRHFQEIITIGSDREPLPHLRIFEKKYEKSKMFEVTEIKKLIKIPQENKSDELLHQKYSNPNKKSTLEIGGSKMKALQDGTKKIGIYRNFYKSQVQSMNSLSGIL